jgi:hypothetical protein
MATKAANKRVCLPDYPREFTRSADMFPTTAHPRVQDNCGKPTAIHCGTPVGEQHPGVRMTRWRLHTALT